MIEVYALASIIVLMRLNHVLQLVDKLTTDENVGDIQLDYEDVSMKHDERTKTWGANSIE